MFKLGITREQLAENIRSLVLRFGRTQTHQDTGIPYRTLDSYMSEEGSEPKILNSILIAKTLGTTVEYMALREGPKSLSNEDLTSYLENSGNSKKEPVTSIGVSGSASAMDEIASFFRSKAMSQQCSMSKLKFDMVQSDGMKGFKKGSGILWDPSDKAPKDGQVFLFDYMNSQLIRETKLIPGKGWVLTSNNDKYDDFALDMSQEAEIAICGRVISVSDFFI